VLKRIDYVLHMLEVSDPLWNFLKINNQSCSCNPCNQFPNINGFDDYFKEMDARTYNKLHLDSKHKHTEYCEMRTVVAHSRFSQLYPEMLYNARTEVKIAWCKSNLGKVNHCLVNTKPDSPYTPQLRIKVVMRGFPNHYEFDVKCSVNDRAQKIIRNIAQRRELNLEDYALVAEIHGKAVILDDDEPLANLEKKKEPEGLLDTINSFFNRHEDYPIRFFI
jgi:uncharacterized ubiquitin-like protein YukD